MNYRERLDIGHCGRTSGALADFANDKKFARPGSKPFYAPDQNFDAEHILLELDIDFAREVMSGKCTSTVSAINDRAREVKFHAAQMKVLSVNDGLGVKLNFTHKGEHLSVHLPRALKESERADVVIRYRVSKPQAGLYFIKPDSHYPKLSSSGRMRKLKSAVLVPLFRCAARQGHDGNDCVYRRISLPTAALCSA